MLCLHKGSQFLCSLTPIENHCVFWFSTRPHICYHFTQEVRIYILGLSIGSQYYNMSHHRKLKELSDSIREVTTVFLIMYRMLQRFIIYDPLPPNNNTMLWRPFGESCHCIGLSNGSYYSVCRIPPGSDNSVFGFSMESHYSVI